MKVEVEEISAVRTRLQVEIPSKEVERELDKVYRQLKKTVTLKGFRPGKAPRSLLEKYYGPQAENEVINNLVNTHYPKAVEQEGLDPVSSPEIEKAEIGEDKVLTFTALIDVSPPVVPKDYTGIEVQKNRVSVSDLDVETELEKIRRENAKAREIAEDRPAAAGDYVEVGIQGKLGGKPMDKLSSETEVIELQAEGGRFGFEEKLIGAVKGETREVPVHYPAEHQDPELADQDVVFHITIKGIKELVLAELDDEFAKDLGEFATLEELRNSVRQRLEETGARKAESEMREQLIRKLVDSHTFEVPPVMVEKEMEKIKEEVKMRMSMSGISTKEAEQYLASKYDQMREDADRSVHASLILEAIAKAENIEISDSEIEEKLKDFAKMADKPYEAVSAHYQQEGRLDSLRRRIVKDKVVDFLVSQSSVTEVDPDDSKETEAENVDDSSSGGEDR